MHGAQLSPEGVPSSAAGESNSLQPDRPRADALPGRRGQRPSGKRLSLKIIKAWLPSDAKHPQRLQRSLCVVELSFQIPLAALNFVAQSKFMPSPSAAEEHLRVIRSLMEKATVYRAISANAAIVAGTLACVSGFLLDGFHDTPATPFAFRLKWLCVLVLSSAINFYFLRRDALRRGEAFISAGMRMALRAMLPALLCGGVFTALFAEGAVVIFWMLFYGLALLSTVHFAPKSLERLGWAFLLVGMATLASGIYKGRMGVGPGDADQLMAFTFGFFHLFYAVCAWPRRQSEPELATMP